MLKFLIWSFWIIKQPNKKFELHPRTKCVGRHDHLHRRTGQHPFGGVKPSFTRMANAICLSRSPAREKKIIINELQCTCRAFFDGRRVVPDERLLCYPTRNVSRQTTRC